MIFFKLTYWADLAPCVQWCLELELLNIQQLLLSVVLCNRKCWNFFVIWPNNLTNKLPTSLIKLVLLNPLLNIIKPWSRMWNLRKTRRKCAEEFLLWKNKRAHVNPGQELKIHFQVNVSDNRLHQAWPDNSLTSWCSEICRHTTKHWHEVYLYCIAHTEKDTSSSLHIKITPGRTSGDMEGRSLKWTVIMIEFDCKTEVFLPVMCCGSVGRHLSAAFLPFIRS